jgi:mttA/Hcf106 family protein
METEHDPRTTKTGPGSPFRSRIEPVFGMGFGELVLILVIVVVVFGSTRLPNLGDTLRDEVRRAQLRDLRDDRLRRIFPGVDRRPWTFSEWTLVVVAVALAALIVANTISPPHLR